MIELMKKLRDGLAGVIESGVELLSSLFEASCFIAFAAFLATASACSDIAHVPPGDAADVLKARSENEARIAEAKARAAEAKLRILELEKEADK